MANTIILGSDDIPVAARPLLVKAFGGATLVATLANLRAWMIPQLRDEVIARCRHIDALAAEEAALAAGATNWPGTGPG